jgi:GNAT superfamily N-acetyltransferase
MPAEPRITVHDDPPAHALRLVDHAIGSFNEGVAPLHEVRPIACFAWPGGDGVAPHGGVDEIAPHGGAVARTWGSCCETLQLWVEPSQRGSGLGTRLMHALHEAAQARGCRTFYLETWSFQAPGFYRKLGYESVLVLEGFGPGLAKHTMVRRLR